jgi:hypothetical protein
MTSHGQERAHTAEWSGKMTSATGEIIALAADNVLASIDIQFA